eukprot:scaffold103687_cov43-Attheya_sp.AAC.1
MQHGPLYFGPDDMRITRPPDLSKTGVQRNTKLEIVAGFDFLSVHSSVQPIDANVASSSTVTNKTKEVTLPMQQD